MSQERVFDSLIEADADPVAKETLCGDESAVPPSVEEIPDLEIAIEDLRERTRTALTQINSSGSHPLLNLIHSAPEAKRLFETLDAAVTHGANSALLFRIAACGGSCESATQAEVAKAHCQLALDQLQTRYRVASWVSVWRTENLRTYVSRRT